MSDDPSGPRPQGDDVKIPFVFVPEGAPVPDAVRAPDWVRIPATFVPRGDKRLTPTGRPWPRDRSGREWPTDRLGRPICPLWDLYPGVRAPGEAAADGGDPIAAFNEADAVFRDPARAAGLVLLAAGRMAGRRPRWLATSRTGVPSPRRRKMARRLSTIFT
jgi:hypothetical protein